MKVKRFKNLWTMGLILMGAILVLFYIAKIFFTSIIIEIAEIPAFVKLGNFVQSNKWYLHIFNFITGYFHGYILYCACLRKPFLSWKGNIVLLCSLVVLRVISEFYPLQYSIFNCAFMVIMPFLVCLWEKNLSNKIFISTVACLGIDLAFEFFSAVVRNLTIITTQPNAVTFLVLLIDLFIWRILLYLFFNNKNTSKGE